MKIKDKIIEVIKKDTVLDENNDGEVVENLELKDGKATIFVKPQSVILLQNN